MQKIRDEQILQNLQPAREYLACTGPDYLGEVKIVIMIGKVTTPSP